MKAFLKSLIIGIIALVFCIGLVIGFGAIGIPFWAFIFFLFYYSSIEHMNPEKFIDTALGGIIGIFVGMSQGIITTLTGNETIGFAVFIVIAVLLIAFYIMKTVMGCNEFAILMMSIMTLFSPSLPILAGVENGISGNPVTAPEAFVRICISYALGCIVIGLILKKGKKKSGK